MPVATGGTKLWEQVNPGEEQKKPDGFRPIAGFGGAPGVLKGSVKGGVKTSDRAFLHLLFLFQILRIRKKVFQHIRGLNRTDLFSAKEAQKPLDIFSLGCNILKSPVAV